MNQQLESGLVMLETSKIETEALDRLMAVDPEIARIKQERASVDEELGQLRQVLSQFPWSWAFHSFQRQQLKITRRRIGQLKSEQKILDRQLQAAAHYDPYSPPAEGLYTCQLASKRLADLSDSYRLNFTWNKPMPPFAQQAFMQADRLGIFDSIFVATPNLSDVQVRAQYAGDPILFGCILPGSGGDFRAYTHSDWKDGEWVSYPVFIHPAGAQFYLIHQWGDLVNSLER